MIVGVVVADGSEATTLLLVRAPSGREHAVQAVVDTGFTTALIPPPALVS